MKVLDVWFQKGCVAQCWKNQPVMFISRPTGYPTGKLVSRGYRQAGLRAPGEC